MQRPHEGHRVPGGPNPVWTGVLVRGESGTETQRDDLVTTPGGDGRPHIQERGLGQVPLTPLLAPGPGAPGLQNRGRPSACGPPAWPRARGPGLPPEETGCSEISLGSAPSRTTRGPGAGHRAIPLGRHARSGLRAPRRELPPRSARAATVSLHAAFPGLVAVPKLHQSDGFGAERVTRLHVSGTPHCPKVPTAGGRVPDPSVGRAAADAAAGRERP